MHGLWVLHQCKQNEEKEQRQGFQLHPVMVDLVPAAAAVVAVAVAVAVAVVAPIPMPLPIILLQTKVAIEEDRIQTDNQPHADRIHALGITTEALIAFAYKHDCWLWPTWQVVRDIIKPATSETLV